MDVRTVAGPRAATFADVQAAAKRIAGVVHRTPVLTASGLDEACGGARVFLKCENFQRTGAFKFRGAYNRLSQFTPQERKSGVVTYSSGNHAQGIALAARELGIPATIVMPTDAVPTKVAATRAYGASIEWIDRQTENGYQTAARIARERGFTVVPPFDDPGIIAGQGTAALELCEQVRDPLDVFLAPLGGGGLLSGCALAMHGASPRTVIYGVETETANDWVLSFAAGHPVRIPPPMTIADGIKTEVPGNLTFPIIYSLVTDVRTVSDDEVLRAMRLVLFRLKILVEPTGAVALALLLSGRLGDLAGQRVGVIISGGNVEPALLAEVAGRTEASPAPDPAQRPRPRL
ncbi:MAG: pyridoxal-phosphate dependent enzyme [Candidatus Limnocylindria bacterium]